MPVRGTMSGAVGGEAGGEVIIGCPTGMPAITKSTNGTCWLSTCSMWWSPLTSPDMSSLLVLASSDAERSVVSSVLCTSSVSMWLGESGVSDSTTCTSGSGDKAPPPN